MSCLVSVNSIFLWAVSWGEATCRQPSQRRTKCVISCGAQPFPKQNNLSLKVFLSSMGFARNILWYSCGHGFKGNNSLPLKLSNNSLRSPITSCLLSKRNVLRYSIQSDHIQECLSSANSYRLLNIICPVRHLALSESYCIFFVLLISMQHGLTVQVKENERKKRMTIDAFKQ